MPPKAAKPPATMRTLIDLTKSTQTLLTHFQSSLTKSSTGQSPSTSTTNTTPSSTTNNKNSEPSTINPLTAIRATTTLLRSHTTTLSLLLLTPPLTPSAIISKISDVSTGALSGLVAAASTVPSSNNNEPDVLGDVMRAELRAQVRRLLGTWSELLSLVSAFAERREKEGKEGKEKDKGPTETEKQDVLAATGVVWEACDGLLKVCDEGVVGLVVKKAEEWRSVLLDAVEELKEWGEDVRSDSDSDDDDDREDKAEGSDDDEDQDFKDEDDIFGAANRIGKDDKVLKELLDLSVKKLKMVGMLYQALIKRRLKTFPKPTVEKATANGEAKRGEKTAVERLDQLLAMMKTVPETVDDLASAFYDLDEDEAKQTLDKCLGEVKSVIEAVKKSWTGQDDEFTAWSDKFLSALDAA